MDSSTSNRKSAGGQTSSWAEDVKATIENSWKSRHDNPYKTVEALMVRWGNDDLGADNEFEALRTVFANPYLFMVYEFIIPDTESFMQLSIRVVKFLVCVENGDVTYKFMLLSQLDGRTVIA